MVGCLRNTGIGGFFSIGVGEGLGEPRASLTVRNDRQQDLAHGMSHPFWSKLKAYTGEESRSLKSSCIWHVWGRPGLASGTYWRRRVIVKDFFLLVLFSLSSRATDSQLPAPTRILTYCMYRANTCGMNK